MSFLSFFTDPILRAPTIGCMLMCLAAGLVGTLVFLRKQSLVGEALSHAAYPGVMIGVLLAGVVGVLGTDEGVLSLFILGGAFLSALVGLYLIHVLEKKWRVHSDAALCFILSAFFGIGLTMASNIQFSYTGLYKQVQAYLYGQAATMTDVHILIYGVLAALILIAILGLYKELQVMTFDRQFAKSLGVRTRSIDTIIFILVVLAVIIGIRSVGVVLMSAMLIAPAVAARQFTNRLSVLFFLAAVFGLLSGFLGNFLSVTTTDVLLQHYPSARLNLPTGPMIVLVASCICLLSLLFAPERGLIVRLLRIAHFRYECLSENVLKTIWRISANQGVSINQVRRYQTISPLYLKFLLWRIQKSGWLEKVNSHLYRLTPDGQHRAAKIVRLHRLWEVYLADYLGVGAERVHRNAEEMEHILTPELEQELTLLLKNPKKDPHQQPIPPKESIDAF